MKIQSWYSRSALFSGVVIASLLLVSWSPTSPDVIVQIGTGNDLDGNTADGNTISAYRGFIAGKNNKLGSFTQFTGNALVVGDSNLGNAFSSVIGGSANKFALTASDTATSAAYLGLFGSGNEISNSNSHLLVSGYGNKLNASSSFAVGTLNDVGVVGGNKALYAAAVGYDNEVTTTGWAIGRSNIIDGDNGATIGTSNEIGGSAQYSCALGAGLKVAHGGVAAVGFWNAPTTTGDAMVVGAGTPTVPSTALRVTYNGDVILGRAQGDISMGDYAN